MVRQHVSVDVRSGNGTDFAAPWGLATSSTTVMMLEELYLEEVGGAQEVWMDGARRSAAPFSASWKTMTSGERRPETLKEVSMRWIGMVSIATIWILQGAALATTYYVGPGGENSRSGTDTTDAWATLTYSCSQLTPGDTLFVLEGEYNELRVGSNLASGTAGSEIVISAYPGHTPWIDGGSPGYGEEKNYTVYLNVDHVVLEGLGVKRGYQAGIQLYWADHVTIRDCKVCSLTSDQADAGTPELITIEQCNYVTVEACSLFDNLGYEHANSPAIMLWGKTENGNGAGHIVRGNVITDCPAGVRYKHGGVGAFVCDSNVISGHTQAAIRCVTDSAFICYNLIYAGIGVNSYGIRIGDDAGGDQHASWSHVYNNTIDHCGNPGILYFKKEYQSSYCDSFMLWNNLVTNSIGDERLLSIFASGESEPDSFYSDYNCWYDSDQTNVIRLCGNSFTVSGFCTATSQDCNSIQEDPLYVDPVVGDFTLQPNSPCLAMGRGGDYDEFVGAFDPLTEGNALTQSAANVGEITDSSFLVLDSVISGYSSVCDSAVLLTDTAEILTLDAVRQDRFAECNADTLGARGLDPSTKYYFWCVAWDEGNADTTDVDSIRTASLRQTSRWFVKPGGDDTRSGADTVSAWATIAHSFEMANPGDTIYVLAGTYAEDSLTPLSDSITLKAYPGHEVWVAGVQTPGPGRAPVFWLDRNGGVYAVVIDSINVKYGRGVAVMFGNQHPGGRCRLLNAKVCSTYAGWGSLTSDMVEINRFDACEIRNCSLFVTGLGGSLPTNHNNVAIIIYSTASTGGDHLIRGNVIHDVVTGIWYKHGGAGGWWCDSNTVHDYHWAGIVATTDSVRIHHNLIYAGDSVGHYGILLADSAGGEMDTRYGWIYNNTVHGCDWGGISLNWLSESIQDTIDCWNNIVCNSPGGSNNEYKILQRTSAPPESLYSDFNCIHDAGSSETIRWLNTHYYTLQEFQSEVGKDWNSISFDPLFVDVDGGDFSLQPDSPCIGSGRSGEDMGAVSYSGEREPVYRTDIDVANRGHKEGWIIDEQVEDLIERYHLGE
jgi:hypothetical protein